MLKYRTRQKARHFTRGTSAPTAERQQPAYLFIENEHAVIQPHYPAIVRVRTAGHYNICKILAVHKLIRHIGSNIFHNLYT